MLKGKVLTIEQARADVAMAEFIWQTRQKLVQHHIDGTLNQVDIRQVRRLIAPNLASKAPCIAYETKDLQTDLERFLVRHAQRTGVILGAE